MPQPKKTEAAEQKVEQPGTPEPEAPEGGAEPETEPTAVTDAMSTEELKAAGIPIDVPWESPAGSAAPLQYGDLGPEKAWTPPEGFTIAGVPFADVLAGVGGGAAHPGPTGAMELPPEDDEELPE
jgi:hypothetical protein